MKQEHLETRQWDAQTQSYVTVTGGDMEEDFEFFSTHIDRACKLRMNHENWSLLNNDQIKVVESITGSSIE